MAVKSKKTEYEKKTVGLVQVVTGEKVSKLTLTEPGKKFKNGTNSVKVNLSDLPKVPKLKSNNKTPIELRVRMNEDDTEVESFGPVRGLHKGKLIDLGKRDTEDADPIPYEKTFKKGEPEENTHLEFFAIYQITEGMFKGVESAYYLHYKFEQDEDDPELTAFSFNTENPKATRGQQLLEWGYVHGKGAPGIWGDPIPWDDDTILPELLERITDNDVEVGLVFDKGYIKLIQPLDDYGNEKDVDDAFPPLDVEDAPPPAEKKNGKTNKPARKIIRKSEPEDDSDDDDL